MHIHSLGAEDTKRTGRTRDLSINKTTQARRRARHLFAALPRAHAERGAGNAFVVRKLGKRAGFVQPRALGQKLPRAGEVGPDRGSEGALVPLLRQGRRNSLVIYQSLEGARVTGEESWGTELNPNAPGSQHTGAEALS